MVTSYVEAQPLSASTVERFSRFANRRPSLEAKKHEIHEPPPLTSSLLIPVLSLISLYGHSRKRLGIIAGRSSLFVVCEMRDDHGPALAYWKEGFTSRYELA